MIDFADVLQWAPIGIFRVRKDGTFLSVNKRLAEMLGYGTTCALLARNLERDVYFDPAQRRSLLMQVESNGTGLRHEVRWRSKTGTPVWVELTGHMVECPGEAAKCFEGLAIDITERKSAEERVREQAALLDRAQDAIYVNDLGGVIGFWNKGAENIYGWTPEEARGKIADALLHKEGPGHADVLRSVLESGEWIGERMDVAKSGRPVTVQCRCSLVRDERGNAVSVLVINTDITEKKELEHQFLRSQRMESIGTLASGIAHDLNNVLAPITMSIAMLRTKIVDPAGLKWLNTIDASAVRAAGIVNQVLSFGRGVTGERVMLQPRHIIHEVVKIATETFPKSITMEQGVAGELWMVSADPTQLHQVLLNLSLNARDAMESGGVLTISAENLTLDEHYARLHIDARPGHYVAISVSDTGTGIPRDVLDRVFDPFFTTKPPGKGTGLGLSTVQAIVRSHGGFVNVYSECGKGTTFRVYLPAKELQESPAGGVTEEKTPGGRGETILVVDDEESILEITRGMLENNGYAALTASNGLEALDLYRRRGRRISVVITDLMMPVMDGSSTIRELRKIHPGVKIIASSGFGSDNSSTATAAGGATLFLKKPYTTGTLLSALDEVLHPGKSGE